MIVNITDQDNQSVLSMSVSVGLSLIKSGLIRYKIISGNTTHNNI